MRLPEAYLEEVLVRDDHFVFFEIQGYYLKFATAVGELFGRNIMSSHSVVRLAEVFCYAPFINNN